MLVTLGLCVIAGVPSLIFLVLAVAASGLWFAPLNTLRTLTLGELLIVAAGLSIGSRLGAWLLASSCRRLPGRGLVRSAGA
jgi:hypothetical protein